MTFEEVLITKEVADKMLGHNSNNYRRVKRALVDKYARAMMEGMWKENGEPIVFDEDGVLKDGQHRLLAVLESGVAVKMLVIRGVKRDISTFDEGGVRTVGDRARAEGLKLHTSTIGAVTMILNEFNDSNYIPNDEKMQYAWDHLESLQKIEEFSRHGSANHILRKSACIAALFCASELSVISDEKLESFCRIVNNGMPNGSDIPDSALALRNTIIEGIRHPDSGRILTGHTLSRPLFEVTWQAIIAFRNGKKTRRRYLPNGSGLNTVRTLKEMQRKSA